MAKRRPSPPQLSADIARNIGLTIIALLAFVFLARGMFFYADRSGLFTVRDVTIAENLGVTDLPELSRLKGKNIFLVNLDKCEARIRGKYPALSNLKVERRFPDQIFVTAFKREAFARVLLGGRAMLIDRDGYLTGPATAAEDALPLVKGLRPPKVADGEAVMDPKMAAVVGIISVFKADHALAAVPLRSVDMSDPSRIACVIGDEDSDGIEVIIDAKNFQARAGELGMLLSRGDVDLRLVRYIDLRFGAPIIGQKKQKKP